MKKILSIVLATLVVNAYGMERMKRFLGLDAKKQEVVSPLEQAQVAEEVKFKEIRETLPGLILLKKMGLENAEEAGERILFYLRSVGRDPLVILSYDIFKLVKSGECVEEAFEALVWCKCFSAKFETQENASMGLEIIREKIGNEEYQKLYDANILRLALLGVLASDRYNAPHVFNKLAELVDQGKCAEEGLRAVQLALHLEDNYRLDGKCSALQLLSKLVEKNVCTTEDALAIVLPLLNLRSSQIGSGLSKLDDKQFQARLQEATLPLFSVLINKGYADFVRAKVMQLPTLCGSFKFHLLRKLIIANKIDGQEALAMILTRSTDIPMEYEVLTTWIALIKQQKGKACGTKEAAKCAKLHIEQNSYYGFYFLDVLLQFEMFDNAKALKLSLASSHDYKYEIFSILIKKGHGLVEIKQHIQETLTQGFLYRNPCKETIACLDLLETLIKTRQCNLDWARKLIESKLKIQGPMNVNFKGHDVEVVLTGACYNEVEEKAEKVMKVLQEFVPVARL